MAGLNVRGLRFTTSPSSFVHQTARQLKMNPLDTSIFAGKLSRELLNPTLGHAAAGGGVALLRPGNIQAKAALQADPVALRRLGRDAVAHEAFHARNRHLGQHESLAQLYGGWKAPLPGASVLERFKSMMSNFRDYVSPEMQAAYQTRP